MSKEVLNEEHAISKLVQVIFDSVAKSNEKRLKKALASDPELKKIVSDLQTGKKRLETHLRQNSGPNFDKRQQNIDSFIDKVFAGR